MKASSIAVGFSLSLYFLLSLLNITNFAYSEERVSPASELLAVTSSNIQKENNLPDAFPVAQDRDFKANLLKSGGVTLLLIGLMVLALYFVKQYKTISQRTPENIRIISNCYLGSNRRVSLLEVGDERLLIGITTSQINLITKLEPSETAEEMKIMEPRKGGFMETLIKKMNSASGNGIALKKEELT